MRISLVFKIIGYIKFCLYFISIRLIYLVIVNCYVINGNLSYSVIKYLVCLKKNKIIVVLFFV